MPRLTILGASARAAAFSAARAGFEPYAIDCFADADLASLCPAERIERYPHDFLAALAAAPEGPWMYTGGLENYPRLVQRLAKMRPLWGNSDESLSRVRDPWQLAAAFAKVSLAFPRVTRSATNGEWLVKPLRGSAGLGVRRATASDRQRAPRGAVLQQYVEGEVESAVFVAVRGRAALLGATQQLIGRDFGLAREFLYAGSIGPLPLGDDEQGKLRRIGAVLAERFGLAGLFGVDFVRGPEEIWPVEVNPRYTASVEILERASRQNFVARHAAACEQKQLTSSALQYPPQACFGKAIVYALRDSRWEKTSVPFLADVPHFGQRFAAGQPVVTVFAEGHSSADVMTTLRERVQQIQEKFVAV